MSRYVKKDDHVKQLVKAVKKSRSRSVKNLSSNLDGEYCIKNLRIYQYGIEVDIQYKGNLKGRRGPYTLNGPEWYTSSLLQMNGTSKTRVNKLIRRNIFEDLRHYLRFFGLELRTLSEIKKVSWV